MFPAHAGMIPDDNVLHLQKSGVPRTRGNDPVKGPKGAAGATCSPHTRG